MTKSKYKKIGLWDGDDGKSGVIVKVDGYVLPSFFTHEEFSHLLEEENNEEEDD